MTAKERLRRAVDALEEDEAADLLAQMAEWRQRHGRIGGIEHAPDPSPLTNEDRAEVASAEAAIDAGDHVGETELRAVLAALREHRE